MSMDEQFTFINLSSSQRGVDDLCQDRKAQVRSQVMKNLRRKQRFDAIRNYEKSLVDVTTSSQARFSARRSQHDQTIENLQLPLVSEARRICGPNLQHDSGFPLSMPHSKLARPVVSSYERRQDPLSACGILAPDAREAIADQEGGFKLRLTLPGWQVGGSNPPSLGQAEFHKLVSIMEAYTTFLSKPLTLLRAANSTRAMDRTSKLKATFEQNSFDELTLFTTRLVNLGHLTAVKFLRENVPVCACAKAKALHQIQRWIQGTGALPPSNLISAVLLVLSFELIRGDRAVRVHLNGLSRLVDLHYGLTNLEHNMDPIASAIISCDLILAACSPGAVPSFAAMERPALTRASGAQDTDYYRSSPLMLSESFSALRRIYVDVPDSLTDLLTSCFLATRDHVTPDDPYSLPDEVGHSIATARVELPPVVLEACRLAAAIYLRSITRRTTFDSVDDQGDARQLGVILHSLDLSYWRGIPYMYLWVLLTGAAAAQGHPERQYLMAELVRFGFSVALEQMDDFKQILLNFIWLRQICRQQL